MDICAECPVRLFNTKNHNLQGIGNPYYGNCIVVPNVDYDAYKKGSMGFSKQVEIIKQSLSSSTGELDNVYIVPFIRCNDTISCEFDDDTLNRCLHHFANDMRTFQFKKVLLLGESVRMFLNCNIKDYLDTLIISSNNKFYNVNYSPLIKYVDEEKYDTFKKYLIKWYYWCTSNINVYQNIVNI